MKRKIRKVASNKKHFSVTWAAFACVPEVGIFISYFNEIIVCVALFTAWDELDTLSWLQTLDELDEVQLLYSVEDNTLSPDVCTHTA